MYEEKIEKKDKVEKAEKTDKTDYELIIECKKGNPRALIVLFTRYEPYLFKKYRGLVHICPYKGDFDDFKQEAYFQFDKAVKYTDLEKITSPDTWKFLTPYTYFIRSLCKDIANKEITESFRIPINHDFATQDPDAIEFMGTIEDPLRATPETLMLQCEVVSEFKKSLTPKELRFCAILEERLHSQSPRPIRTLSEDLGYSSSWGFTMFKKIKEKYQQSINPEVEY